jgi:hypothetical protein
MATSTSRANQPTEPIVVPVSVYRPYSFQVIAPRSNDRDREAVSLEATMQSLVVDDKHPVALEITAVATQKRFLVRSESEAACEHAKAHIRVRYPQADIRPVSEASDPFMLGTEERVSVTELRPGAPSYLPMRALDEQEISQPGADPILGVLASLALPTDLRAICQIALLPAPPSWSRPDLRKAVEHPLEPERIERQESLAMAGTGGPSTTGVVILVIVFLLLLLYSRFKNALPGWVYRALGDLFLHGTWPALTSDELSLLVLGGISILVGLAVLFIGIDQIKRHFFAKPLYDQRLVAAKTGKMAYRVRIRLYVIGPGPAHAWWVLVWQIAWWRVRWIRTWCWSYVRWVWNMLRCTVKTAKRPWKMRWQVLPRQVSLPLRPDISWQQAMVQRKWEKKQQLRRADILASLSAAYRQFDTASAGYFVPKGLSSWRATLLIRPSSHWILSRWSGWACDVARSAHYVTGNFLSMAWRLPHSMELADLPLIEQKRSRTLLIPSCLIASPGIVPLGFSEHGGYTFPFAPPPGFFTAHTLIGGKSGEGKSTLMEHLASLAMMEGSLCLLDPHGDLARDVLCLVPPDRLDDVVYLDLGDKEYSVGFNPLDVKLGQDRDLMVASLVATFSHIWDAGWGTRMEAPFRAALMTLYEANEALCKRDPVNGPDQQYTLLDIFQVLTDESFCHDLLVAVKDTYVHRFWHMYYDPLDLRQQRERIDPVVTKMAQFETKVARRILGQSQSTINLSQLVAENKILVVRLASGESGTQTSPLVGATLLGLLMTALREQSVLAQDRRSRMTIIIDEFQSLPGADYSVLMAELRKYGAAAVLATQSFEYLNKLNPYLLPTVLANVKQYFLFRMSAEDAHTISPELDVAEADIVNIDSHNCYVKMTYQNRQQPTFSLHIQLPVLFDQAQAVAIRDRCRQVYARLAADVEEQLIAAVGRAISASLHRKAKEEEEKEAKRRYHDNTEKGETMKGTSESSVGDTAPSTATSGTTPSKENPAGSDEKSKPHFPSKKNREKDLVTSFDLHPLDESEKES